MRVVFIAIIAPVTGTIKGIFMVVKRIKTAAVIEILLHLLFWAFITLLPILTRPTDPGFHMLFSPWHLMFINLLLAIQFYLNAFVLIPQFLNKHNRPWAYLGLLATSFVIIDFCIVHTQPVLVFPQNIRPFGPPHMGHFSLLPLIAITAAGFAYRYLADRFKQINNSRDITNSALVSELAFLRSQISPHFIFNVINSVVALSRINPKAVEPTLMQLSHLLRYMLYITDEEKVTLKQKADYLRSYIELQKLRFEDQVDVDFKFDILYPNHTIEPMLIIPFVENAFKYGTSYVAKTNITGYLKTDKNTLYFTIANTYNANEVQTDAHHGIGLNNVKRRLDLLYPDKHSLVIDQDAENYSINLQIQFK
jgi:two-component system LytT family sensor kinase